MPCKYQKNSGRNNFILARPYAARKTIFSFSRRPEKMIFPKKSRWNLTFLLLRGNMTFFSPENMISAPGGKWKMIFLKKIHGNMIFSSNVLKRWSFQKGPCRYMIFLVLSQKILFFPQKHDIFSLDKKSGTTFLKKYIVVWYFLCTCTGVTDVAT